MTDRPHPYAFDPTARCLACDTPVLERCNGGEVEHIEVTRSPDGEFAIIAGRLQRVPSGGMVAVGVSRYRDHKLRCKASLKPEPETVKTVKTPIRERARRGT